MRHLIVTPTDPNQPARQPTSNNQQLTTLFDILCDPETFKKYWKMLLCFQSINTTTSPNTDHDTKQTNKTKTKQHSIKQNKNKNKYTTQSNTNQNNKTILAEANKRSTYVQNTTSSHPTDLEYKHVHIPCASRWSNGLPSLANRPRSPDPQTWTRGCSLSPRLQTESRHCWASGAQILTVL